MFRTRDEVLNRLINTVFSLEDIFADGLNDIRLETGLQKYRGDAILLLEAIWDAEDFFRAKIEQVPGRELAEDNFLLRFGASMDFEGIGNKVERAIRLHRLSKRQRIELEVTGYSDKVVSGGSFGTVNTDQPYEEKVINIAIARGQGLPN
jgi:hypothetical protein